MAGNSSQVISSEFFPFSLMYQPPVFPHLTLPLFPPPFCFAFIQCKMFLRLHLGCRSKVYSISINCEFHITHPNLSNFLFTQCNLSQKYCQSILLAEKNENFIWISHTHTLSFRFFCLMLALPSHWK